jgi:hypothetical protein
MQSPVNLGATLEANDDGIEVARVLLNPGDFMVIQLLVTSPKLDVKADTRIVGVSSMVPLNAGVRLKPGTVQTLATEIVGVAIIIAAMGALLYFFGSPAPEQRPSQEGFNSHRMFVLSFVVLSLIMILTALCQWILGRIRNNSRRYIDDFERQTQTDSPDGLPSSANPFKR